MTTTETPPALRRFVNAGYVPAGPVQDCLRNLIAETGISFHRLSMHVQWASSTLLDIYKGNSFFVHPDLAKKLSDLTAADLNAAYPPAAVEVDDIVLERIMTAAPVTVAAQDKPVYARALHKRGWQKTRISKRLAMSGRKVSEALAATK